LILFSKATTELYKKEDKKAIKLEEAENPDEVLSKIFGTPIM